MFDHKRDAAGRVVRYKARSVAKGYTQSPGINYVGVWAPCPARATVWAVSDIVVGRDLGKHVFDIKNAYLNPPIDLPAYVRHPERYEVAED